MDSTRSRGAGTASGLVADASALVEYAVGSRVARAIGTYLEATDVALHVPAVCDLELVNTLRSLARAQILPGARADQALALYLALPLERHDHRALVGRVWALRMNFAPYDAAYVALAEALHARLLTVDGAFARATKRHTDVEVVGL